MRQPVDSTRVQRLLEALGRECKGPGRIYVTGGATALIHGWRTSTADVDLKLDPEPNGAFEAIAHLKDELDVNIELAAPDDFLPALPDWQGHSAFIARHGKVDFFHYDYRAQALSKIARGYDRDLTDVDAMLARGLVTTDQIRAAFGSIAPHLIRYPQLDARALSARVESFLADR